MKTKTIKVNVLREDIRKGVREEPDSCPIARALKRQGFDSVYVDNTSIRFDDGSVERVFNCPAMVARFVDRFDNGVPKHKLKPFSFTLKLADDQYGDGEDTYVV